MFIVIGIVFWILTVLAIIDLAWKDFGSLGKKVAWAFIIFIPFIGCIMYFIIGYRQGKKQSVTLKIDKITFDNTKKNQ
ncbi:MAG: PLDc N-terminal domain-containing protein [Desulfobacterales bacterium]|nr:PLDc N-terminal domain-containing protein [Desulfobacterales bacterium]